MIGTGDKYCMALKQIIVLTTSEVIEKRICLMTVTLDEHEKIMEQTKCTKNS